MFHPIPEPIAARMAELERRDAGDRADGTPLLQRMRQIPPETGRFLALLAAGAPAGEWLEIGASAGYSTLWLSLAAKLRGQRLTTFEILPQKAALARETYRLAGVESLVNLVEGDARLHLAQHAAVGFCFLDAEKEVYAECYEAVVPNLVPGGLLAADNAINHRHVLQPMLDRALADERLDALIVPIGTGVLVGRKL
jgi:predicted O-methyltransferase YrrM